VGQQPRRAPARDALTGAPLALRPGSPVFLIRDKDERPMPKRIDTREPFHTDSAHGGGLGGKQWSRDFERYIRPVLPKSLEEAKARWEAWWSFPIVLLRLNERMGAERLEAALLFHRDGWSVKRIAIALRHTTYWVGMAVEAAEWLVRRCYLPYSLLDRYLADFAASLQPTA
jgi:hypothetical protein